VHILVQAKKYDFDETRRNYAYWFGSKTSTEKAVWEKYTQMKE
jgi:hypothetical protein